MVCTVCKQCHHTPRPAPACCGQPASQPDSQPASSQPPGYTPTHSDGPAGLDVAGGIAAAATAAYHTKAEAKDSKQGGK